MSVLPRNHDPRVRRDLLVCHRLQRHLRDPSPSCYYSPLPCLKTPFQIENGATGHAKLGDKLRHCLECRHSYEPRRKPLVDFRWEDNGQTALPRHTGSPKTACSLPALETSLGTIRSSPLSIAAITSCDITEKMLEVIPPVTLRIRVSIFSSIWLSRRSGKVR